MRRLVGILAGAIVVGLCANAATMSGTVDTGTFTKGVPFHITLQIDGNDVKSIDPPAIDGADIDKDPVYSGTEVNVVNGRMTVTKSFTYTVTPNRTGQVTIPPFRAAIDGESLQTRPLAITVQDSPKPADANTRSISGDQILFTQIRTDKKEAYVGEAITLTMEVWIIQGASVRQYDQGGFPELTGFYALPREPGEPSIRTDTRDGTSYKVATFTQTLFGTSPGEQRIGPWTWDCAVAYRTRGVRDREIKTEPFTVRVKPLPPPPPDFSGSVGRYQAVAALSKNSTDVGVPISLTVGIVGDGNPDAIGTPQLPAIDGVYAGEPKIVNLDRQNGKNFLYKLTPQRPGAISVPSIPYVYFDPDKGAYETAQTESLTLAVRATAKHEEQVVVGAGGSATAAIGPDILDVAALSRPLHKMSKLTVPALLGYTTPVVAYIAFAIFLLRQRRFRTDRAYARARGALKNGLGRLAYARESARAADVLYTAVTTYIEDQFNLPEIGMTSADAQGYFQSKEVPAEIAGAFHKILKSCERARYAGADLSKDETDALIQGAQSAMERLDEYVKQGRAA